MAGENSSETKLSAGHSIPLDILGDLITRFLIYVPPESKQNLIRICFQIELAYWYYLDFYVANDNALKGCSMTEFAAHVFKHVPSLQPHYAKLQSIITDWRSYKQSVPTYGAILVSEGLTHVLLVQSYFAKSSWGFPKGKVNQEEDPSHCAIREVFEETGYDISASIDPDLYLESVIHDQLVRLYLVMGIPMTTKFQPRTRNEIKACEWFAIADLPNSKKDSGVKVRIGMNANAFYMVMPFVKRLKNLATTTNGRMAVRQKAASVSEVEGEGSGRAKAKVRQRADTDDVKAAVAKKNRVKKVAGTSKRQLFVADAPEEMEFSAPSWLNFKFDKVAIMECVP